MPEELQKLILAALERWRDRQLDEATNKYAKCMEIAQTQAAEDICKTAYLKRVKEILELYEKMKKISQKLYDSVFKRK